MNVCISQSNHQIKETIPYLLKFFLETKWVINKEGLLHTIFFFKPNIKLCTYNLSELRSVISYLSLSFLIYQKWVQWCLPSLYHRWGVELGWWAELSKQNNKTESTLQYKYLHCLKNVYHVLSYMTSLQPHETHLHM